MDIGGPEVTEGLSPRILSYSRILILWKLTCFLILLFDERDDDKSEVPSISRLVPEEAFSSTTASFIWFLNQIASESQWMKVLLGVDNRVCCS
mmetsp:Transcript_16578/g.23055  ORF Transcript_16578/g.23055 Transcript_16578/m.23055 type:complete len:93 (+) Transcript_16578:485-763(+)